MKNEVINEIKLTADHSQFSTSISRRDKESRKDLKRVVMDGDQNHN